MTDRSRYILEGDPHKVKGRLMRDILVYDANGHKSVAVEVPNANAIDMLDALRAAYQQGREDNAQAHGQPKTEHAVMMPGGGYHVRNHTGHGEATLSLTVERPGGERVHQSWTICDCYLPGLHARLGPPEHETVATKDATEAIGRAALGQPGSVLLPPPGGGGR